MKLIIASAQPGEKPTDRLLLGDQGVTWASPTQDWGDPNVGAACCRCFQNHRTKDFWLVVSTHLKNISQNGNLPQIGVKIKNLWNHHLDFVGVFGWCPTVTSILMLQILIDVDTKLPLTLHAFCFCCRVKFNVHGVTSTKQNNCGCFGDTPPKNEHSPWKVVVGRRFLSFWEGDFSGANC